jgi:hypothetical protein
MFATAAEVRICQVITRTLALTWVLLRQQPARWCPIAWSRHLVNIGELAVLKMRDAMPLSRSG